MDSENSRSNMAALLGLSSSHKKIGGAQSLFAGSVFDVVEEENETELEDDSAVREKGDTSTGNQTAEEKTCEDEPITPNLTHDEDTSSSKSPPKIEPAGRVQLENSERGGAATDGALALFSGVSQLSSKPKLSSSFETTSQRDQTILDKSEASSSLLPSAAFSESLFSSKTTVESLFSSQSKGAGKLFEDDDVVTGGDDKIEETVSDDEGLFGANDSLFKDPDLPQASRATGEATGAIVKQTALYSDEEDNTSSGVDF